MRANSDDRYVAGCGEIVDAQIGRQEQRGGVAFCRVCAGTCVTDDSWKCMCKYRINYAKREDGWCGCRELLWFRVSNWIACFVAYFNIRLTLI